MENSFPVYLAPAYEPDVWNTFLWHTKYFMARSDAYPEFFISIGKSS